MQGKYTILEIALKSSTVDVNDTDEKGRTPLHHAMMRLQNLCFDKTTTQAGTKNNSKNTQFLSNGIASSVEIIKTLIKHNASLSQYDDNLTTPMGIFQNICLTNNKFMGNSQLTQALDDILSFLLKKGNM